MLKKKSKRSDQARECTQMAGEKASERTAIAYWSFARLGYVSIPVIYPSLCWKPVWFLVWGLVLFLKGKKASTLVQ